MTLTMVPHSCKTHSTQRSTSSLLSLLALVLVTFGVCAQAQQPDARKGVLMPESVSPAGPYLPDPGFNGGNYVVESFSSLPSVSALGKKILRLENGEVIVAGLAPAMTGTAFTGTPFNLGLVRYDAAGGELAWSNPGIYGFNSNLSVVYPNIAYQGNGQKIINVVDIKILHDQIYVLVDNLFEGHIQPVIIVFGVDGSFRSYNGLSQTGLNEYSGGMVIYETSTLPTTVKVAVAASRFDGVWRPAFELATVNADSSLHFAGTLFPNPGNYCPTNRGCILRAIASSGGADANGPFLYVAGTRQSNIPDNGEWDFLVMKVSALGTPVTSFGGSGVTTVAFDDGLTKYDDANSIAVATSGNGPTQHDQLYVSGFVNRVCNDGVGVAKLKDNGTIDTTFGASGSGKIIFGGGNPSVNVTCAQIPPPAILAMYSTASALSSDKLAIAGYTTVSSGGQTDSRVAIIDSTSGNLDSYQPYYLKDASGNRIGQSAFGGVAQSGNGTFTMSGNVQVTGSVQQYGTLRVRGDRIFANGFE